MVLITIDDMNETKYNVSSDALDDRQLKELLDSIYDFFNETFKHYNDSSTDFLLILMKDIFDLTVVKVENTKPYIVF